MTSFSEDHLAGIESRQVRSRRLTTRLLTAGSADGEPVLFLHGNLSSSVFWEETLLALPRRFQGVAVDLRGYGNSDPDARIQAMRGVADWCEDVVALADALHWDRFHLVAHSLGGCVAWGLLAEQTARLHSVTLVAPGPPCGFGGARGELGQLNHEDGAGSGAALVHPDLVRRLAAGERDVADELMSPRAVMNRLYWKPPFRPAREEALLTAMLSVHLGPQRYPGDFVASPHWPGFAPGQHGPVNAISPRYNQEVLPRLLAASGKPRLLWIQGADDPIICDNSMSDAAVQGQLGFRPEWPGVEVFPPQPFLSQVAYAVESYAAAGGRVRRVVIPEVGHTPYLEQPRAFQQALIEHLTDDVGGVS